MCISDPANEWWWDVLENGPSSPFARYFDINWNPPKKDLIDKVLLPILGDRIWPYSGGPANRRMGGVVALAARAGARRCRFWAMALARPRRWRTG